MHRPVPQVELFAVDSEQPCGWQPASTSGAQLDEVT
jgi:hypothetical protein